MQDGPEGWRDQMLDQKTGIIPVSPRCNDYAKVFKAWLNGMDFEGKDDWTWKNQLLYVTC